MPWCPQWAVESCGGRTNTHPRRRAQKRALGSEFPGAAAANQRKLAGLQMTVSEVIPSRFKGPAADTKVLVRTRPTSTRSRLKILNFITPTKTLLLLGSTHGFWGQDVDTCFRGDCSLTDVGGEEQLERSLEGRGRPRCGGFSLPG